jgi:hypothetical protein
MPGDAALGGVEAEAKRFPLDAWRAPGILGGHPPDECSGLPRQRRAPGALSSPGQPIPVDAEPGAVPAHDGVRLDDGEGFGPAAPIPAQQDPEDPVRRPDVGMSPTGQGGEALAEGQVLDHRGASRAHGREERRQESYEEAKHRAGENPGPGEESSMVPGRTGFWRAKGNRIEALKGDRKGQYSIRIKDHWRICFAWPDRSPGPTSVEIVDYH